VTRIKQFLALDGYTPADAVEDGAALVSLLLAGACLAVIGALIAGA
jgi:hypothetical protein